MQNLILKVKSLIYAALCSIYLFTFGLLHARHRSFICEILGHFGYFEIQPALPVVSAAQVTDFNSSPVCLYEPESAVGNVTLFELAVIGGVLSRLRPKTAFEFGTFDGRTTLNIAGSGDCDVYTLDLPCDQLGSVALKIERSDQTFIKKAVSGVRFHNRPQERRITQLYGDSAAFNFDKYLGDIDFVFVDASHSYEYVLNDSRKAIQLLRNGRGVILWHDYSTWYGVTRALNELRETDSRFKDLKWIKNTTLAYLSIGGAERETAESARLGVSLQSEAFTT